MTGYQESNSQLIINPSVILSFRALVVNLRPSKLLFVRILALITEQCTRSIREYTKCTRIVYRVEFESLCLNLLLKQNFIDEFESLCFMWAQFHLTSVFLSSANLYHVMLKRLHCLWEFVITI